MLLSKEKCVLLSRFNEIFLCYISRTFFRSRRNMSKLRYWVGSTGCQRNRLPFYAKIYVLFSIIARLCQNFWITAPKNFYYSNQLRTRCRVGSYNSWLTVPLGGVVQTRWLNLANIYMKCQKLLWNILSLNRESSQIWIYFSRKIMSNLSKTLMTLQKNTCLEDIVLIKRLVWIFIFIPDK